jgi:hypothetical protein
MISAPRSASSAPPDGALFALDPLDRLVDGGVERGRDLLDFVVPDDERGSERDDVAYLTRAAGVEEDAPAQTGRDDSLR